MDKVPCEKRRKEMGRVIPYMASDTLWGELVERHCDWMQYPVKMQSSAPEIALFVNTLMSARGYFLLFPSYSQRVRLKIMIFFLSRFQKF